MSGSVRDIMRHYKGSLSTALILLTAFTLGAQSPQPPDCLGLSKGLFAVLDSPKGRPCLYASRDGVEKAKPCDGNGDERVMGKDDALKSILEYQDHLRKLEPVKKDSEISWILGRVNRQEWLDAAAFIIAGPPSPKDPPSSSERFRQHLAWAQVQMYNDDQIEGPGFGEQSFYENAVVPGLELYAVKKWGAQWRMSPADLAKLCGGPGEAPAPDLDTVVRAQVRKELASP